MKHFRKHYLWSLIMITAATGGIVGVREDAPGWAVPFLLVMGALWLAVLVKQIWKDLGRTWARPVRQNLLAMVLTFAASAMVIFWGVSDGGFWPIVIVLASCTVTAAVSLINVPPISEALARGPVR